MLTMSQRLLVGRLEAFIALTDKFRLAYPANQLPFEVFLSDSEYRDFLELRSSNELFELGFPIDGNSYNGYLVRRFPSPVFSCAQNGPREVRSASNTRTLPRKPAVMVNI